MENNLFNVDDYYRVDCINIEHEFAKTLLNALDLKYLVIEIEDINDKYDKGIKETNSNQRFETILEKYPYAKRMGNEKEFIEENINLFKFIYLVVKAIRRLPVYKLIYDQLEPLFNLISEADVSIEIKIKTLETIINYYERNGYLREAYSPLFVLNEPKIPLTVIKLKKELKLYKSELEESKPKERTNTTSNNDDGIHVEVKTAGQKVMFLKELGVLDFLIEKHHLKIGETVICGGLATIIVGMTGEKKRTLSDILLSIYNNSGNNNPYPANEKYVFSKIEEIKRKYPTLP